MSEKVTPERQMHYGPTYPAPPLGNSFAACRPGQQDSTLTTHVPWVTCEKCLQAIGALQENSRRAHV